ncbi:MAG: crossover junction endodeoxyribonuclease RuvC [Myxococcota bacterium]
MRILGIDPGSRNVGFGVVECAAPPRHGLHVAHGVLRLTTSRDLPARIAELLPRLQAVLREHRPQVAVVEEVFVSANARSALLLGQARGAVLALLALEGIPVTGVRPAVLKLALTGSGRAGKHQVACMVAALLDLPARPAADAADALALALYHARGLVGGGLGVHGVVTAPRRLSARGRRRALEELARSHGAALPKEYRRPEGLIGLQDE